MRRPPPPALPVTPSMADTATAAQLPALRLKCNEDRRLNAGHLWVFSNEVDTVDRRRSALLTAGRSLCAAPRITTAHSASPASTPRRSSAARLLEHLAPCRMPAWFLRYASRGCWRCVKRLFRTPDYRRAYGESDGLPGLVIDRYGSRCAVQIGTAGMERYKAADPGGAPRRRSRSGGCSARTTRRARRRASRRNRADPRRRPDAGRRHRGRPRVQRAAARGPEDRLVLRSVLPNRRARRRTSAPGPASSTCSATSAPGAARAAKRRRC